MLVGLWTFAAGCGQILSLATGALLRVLERNPSSDVRNLMKGSHSLLEALIGGFSCNPSYLLEAFCPVRMLAELRAKATGALERAVKVGCIGGWFPASGKWLWRTCSFERYLIIFVAQWAVQSTVWEKILFFVTGSRHISSYQVQHVALFTATESVTFHPSSDCVMCTHPVPMRTCAAGTEGWLIVPPWQMSQSNVVAIPHPLKTIWVLFLSWVLSSDQEGCLCESEFVLFFNTSHEIRECRTV